MANAKSTARRLHRTLNAVVALLAVAMITIGATGAAANPLVGGREAPSVTIQPAASLPTGYPTASPVAEEPENRIVGMFRALLVAAMLVAVGAVVAIVLVVRGVKRRRARR